MEIILRPIVTEKMMAQSDKLHRYGFIVDKTANKIQIKAAVETLYGVSVMEVNTMRYGGKAKSRFTKTGLVKGKTNSFKKAVVTLKEGEVIDFYSNI
ncbi:MAG: 50S ribosomal protein L23 [Bacteroidales bacterium]|nr:50S ribosomal protein L23 [Bacteroidales bacterium]HOY38307.1 50S ribosomal protein L23 [Bacteroidales bacterium]HQP04632.1 50S ribosomal protein L23 [Bacteroidales bacterium]